MSHCVRWGPCSPPKGHIPQFSAYVRCGQAAGWTKMLLGMEVGLGPGNVVRWGPSSPQKKGHSHQFSAHVYCGQTAGWIKMPLVTEVDFGPGDVVLDAVPAPHRPLVFGPCLLWLNGWMDEDTTWYRSRPRPRPHCVRRGLSSIPRERSTAAPSSFRPMSIVAMIAHLSCC